MKQATIKAIYKPLIEVINETFPEQSVINGKVLITKELKLEVFRCICGYLYHKRVRSTFFGKFGIRILNCNPYVRNYIEVRIDELDDFCVRITMDLYGKIYDWERNENLRLSKTERDSRSV